MRWFRCNICAHVFTEGHWSDEANNLLFSKTNPSQVVGANLEAQRFVSAQIVEKVSRVRPYCGGAWIDVGPGNGSLLFTAQEWGYKPIGVEVRAGNARALASRGVNCTRDISDLPPDRTNEVISFADSLEHMTDPRRALVVASELLGKGGVMFLSMPNMDTEVWRALDRAGENPYWNEIEHYHNFTRGRVCALLGSVGFMPVHYDVSRRYRCGMEIIAERRP